MSTTKVLGFNLTVLAWEGLSGGPRIGYVPDSTLGPGQKRRLDGESVARTLSDTASGRDIARTQPGELMRFTRDGTIVVVHSTARLAQNLDDLRSIVPTLTNKGAGGVWKLNDRTIPCRGPVPLVIQVGYLYPK
ncbi:recombinase family protein [Pseudarthrobacter sp. AB1]|uniref:recombinase family protein n=1 Tax=Pseudarthrobacter sp. AB1 TaxID=2138309 RepID=UPI00186B8199|nr:recombinase family protein [Pseudarthrobacter sp. AB1]